MKFEYNKEVIDENLQEVFISTPLFSYKEASKWYKNANNTAKEYSIKYNIEHFKVCGIIAALSPQKSWPENLSITELFLETKGEYSKHMPVMHNKALSIYNCTDVDCVESVLNGRKIVNFYNNIMNPADNNYVYLDVHMLQLMTSDISIKSCTTKQYDFLKDIFIKFAEKQGFYTSTLQAILWCYFRNAKWGK